MTQNYNNEKNPLITVAIPIFNTPIKFFKILIQQVLTQTYKNLDIYIYDDASRIRESINYAQKLAESDKRIRIQLGLSNKGILEVRNHMSRNAAKGAKYFIFLDSDDYIEADYLETLAKPLLPYNGKTLNVFSCTKFKKFNKKYPEIVNKEINYIYHDEDLLKKTIKMGYFGTALWNKLFTVELIQKLSLKEEYGTEDEQANLQLIEYTDLVIQILGKYYYYRQRLGSVTKSKSSKAIYLFYLSSKYYLEKAVQNNLDCVNERRLINLYHKFLLSCLKYDKKFVFNDILKEIKSMQRYFGEVKTLKKRLLFIIKHPYLFRFVYLLKHHIY